MNNPHASFARHPQGGRGQSLGVACATIYPLGDDAPSIPESAFIVPEAPLIGEVVLAERMSVWSGVVLRLAQSAADYARRRERCKLQLKCIG